MSLITLPSEQRLRTAAAAAAAAVAAAAAAAADTAAAAAAAAGGSVAGDNDGVGELYSICSSHKTAIYKWSVRWSTCTSVAFSDFLRIR